MANRETFVSNSFQTTLSFDLPVGGTTVEVVSTIGSPGLPFYLVIDADNDALREIVLVDSFKDDDTFGLSSPDNRGVDGTLDVAHSVGALVGVYPVAGLWTDINDRVDATQSSVTTHTHDGVSTAQVSLTDVSGHDAAAHADFRTVGEVIWFAGTSVPAGFLECNGQAVSRVTYADLFSEIGTTWGVGDGSSTFNVPDLRDAVPVGASAARPLGDEGGAETHAHGNPSTSTAGSHAHTQGDSGSAGSHAHSNPSTNSGGAHTHTNGSTGTAGAHGHSNPSTGSAGDHGHTNPNTSAVSNHSHSLGGASTSSSKEPGGQQSPAMSHTHSVSSAGGHDHSVGGTSTAGSHAHTQGNTGSAGNHDHNIPTTSSGGSHAHTQGNTGSVGDHAHTNPNTNSTGDHDHAQGDTTATSSYPPYRALMALIRH